MFISHEEGQDDTDCLILPGKKCKSLNFAVDTIIRTEMTWIHTVYIDGDLTPRDFGSHHEPYYVDAAPTVHRSITLSCSEVCTITNAIQFLLPSDRKTLTIQWENVTFDTSIIRLQNIQMNFLRVQFKFTTIFDEGKSGDISLHFTRTKFLFGSLVEFDDASTISCFVRECEFIDAGIIVTVPFLRFELKHTFCRKTQLKLKSDMFLSALRNIQFVESDVQVITKKMNVDMMNSAVSSGGLALEKMDSDASSSWIAVSIMNCTFQNNSKSLKSRGAVEVLFHAPMISYPSRSFIKIINSTFINNSALSQVSLGFSCGGAISIQSQFSLEYNHCNMLNIEIESSYFGNNQAIEGGGSLCVSGKCLDTQISDCRFSVTDEVYDSEGGIFISSTSDISIEKSTFTVQAMQVSPTLIQLEMESHVAEIWHFDMMVQCPVWFEAQVMTQFNAPQLAKQIILRGITVSCTSCPPTLYIPTDGSFSLSYSENEIVSLQGSNKKPTTHLLCSQCPTGGVCPGDDLSSKPNFWGIWTEEGIVFYQCPPDYCCQKSPCSGYNQCSGNRAGTLCGTCQKGYSVSILSSNCVKSTKCDDQWFWILAVLAIVAYMLWYTLKNDIFELPVCLKTKICGQSSEGDNHDNVDKGYFGIMIYFVQVTVILRLSFTEDTRNITKIFSLIESYLTLGLSIDISLFSESVCPHNGLTTTLQYLFKFLFVLGIFSSWFLLYSVLKMTVIVTGKSQMLTKIKIKLVLGLIEIVKYTYLEFTFIAFKSLTCVLIIDSQVWFYDGSVQCYSYWQIAMICFIVLYCLPYPIMLYLGMKMLQKKQTSRKLFYVGVCFPLLSSVYWSVSVCRQENKRHNENIDHDQDNVDDENSAEGIIYSGFKGGYRESTEGTQYWECIIMTRRLLLSATALIPNSVIQLCVCLVLCFCFLFHHVRIYPFRHVVSNKAETLSLTLLCCTAGINLYKSAFLRYGVDIEGESLNIILNFTLAEKMFMLVLLAFILCFETVFLWTERTGKAMHTRAAGHVKNQKATQAIAGPSNQHSDANDYQGQDLEKQSSVAHHLQEGGGQTHLEVKVEAEPKATAT